MKTLISVLISYLWVAGIAAFLQFFTLIFINLAYLDALPYFYNGVLYILLASLVVAGFLYWRRLLQSYKIVLLSFAIVVNLSYFALIPTIVDRSISVFVLNELESGPKTLEELELAFVEDFVRAGEAVSKRLSEQELSGNLRRREDGSFELTVSGRGSVSLFRFLGRLYNTDPVSID